MRGTGTTDTKTTESDRPGAGQTGADQASTDQAGADQTSTEETGDEGEAEVGGGSGSHPSWRRRIEGAAAPLRRASSDGRFVLVAGSVAAVVTALWLMSGAWGDRPPSGADTIAHLIRSEFAIEHLISEGRIDGWSPSFILGYETFLFSGPAFVWAVALVQVLSLGLLSVADAFKAVFVGSFVVLPLSVAFLARSFGLGRRAAGAAAILTLAVNNPFGGVGVSGLFDIGLATHQFAASFFFLTVGGALRLLHRPSARWTVFTACSMAVLLAAHGLSVIIFVVLLAVVLVLMVLSPRSHPEDRDLATIVRRAVDQRLGELGIVDDERLGPSAAPDTMPPTPAPMGAPSGAAIAHLALALAVAGALAACVLLPLIVHRELQGIFTAWGTPPLGQRAADIWSGRILFRPGVAPLLLAGFLYGITQLDRGRRYALALVAAPPVFLVVAHASINLWPNNVIPTQLTTRALGYLGVLAILPLAMLMSWIGGRFGRAGGPVALGLALAVVIIPLGPWRETPRQIDEPVPAMAEAARQLAVRVPDGARFATERDISDEVVTTNVDAPQFWLAWASGRPTVNSYNPESSASPGLGYEADNIGDRPPEAVASALSRLGVTHLVTLSDEAADQVAPSARFDLEWQESPLAIFAVAPDPGQPEPAALVSASTPIEAELLTGEPEHLVIQVDTSQPVRATLAVGWSPKWHAQLDGEPVALQKATDGLLELALPAGSSRLALDFRPDVWDRLGVVITLATVALLGGWLVRRRRRHPQRPAGSGHEEAAGDEPGPVEPEPHHGPQGAQPVADVGPHRGR